MRGRTEAQPDAQSRNVGVTKLSRCAEACMHGPSEEAPMIAQVQLHP
jgi:hypothetical protein